MFFSTSVLVLAFSRASLWNSIVDSVPSIWASCFSYLFFLFKACRAAAVQWGRLDVNSKTDSRNANWQRTNANHKWNHVFGKTGKHLSYYSRLGSVELRWCKHRDGPSTKCWLSNLSCLWQLHQHGGQLYKKGCDGHLDEENGKAGNKKGAVVTCHWFTYRLSC